jgi:hypothetical protein
MKTIAELNQVDFDQTIAVPGGPCKTIAPLLEALAGSGAAVIDVEARS